MMPRYRMQVTHDVLREIGTALTGQGRIVGIDQEGAISWEVEADDLWEAAEAVRDTQSALITAGLTASFDFSKPREIEEGEL